LHKHELHNNSLAAYFASYLFICSVFLLATHLRFYWLFMKIWGS
jgi:hypothetical protein